MLGLSCGAVAAVLSPSPALAKCDLPAGATTIGASPPVTAIPGGGTVTCPTGSRTTASFTGRASDGATVEGFDVTVEPGAELTGQAGDPAAATLPDFSAITAGPGSSITVGKNAVIRAAPGSAQTQEAILLSGDGSTITNEGRIEADRQAIRSAFSGPGLSSATNATVRNSGEILSFGTLSSATISLGDDADVLNTGLIRRDTSGFDFPSGQPAGQGDVSVIGVSLGEGSLLRNEGRIEVESTATRANTSAGVAVRVLGGSRVENAGEIVATALDGGNAVASSGLTGGTTIVNEAGGLIDGSGVGNAISLSGDGNTVENRGRIVGGRDGAIVSAPGEDFRLVQHKGSSLTGDVTARTQERVLQTIEEFGGGILDPKDPADVALFQSRCGIPNPPLRCTKLIQTRPRQATAEWITDQDVKVDTSVTQFQGVNRFVLRGDSTLTLAQDFAAADVDAGDQARGEFRGTLTVEPQDSGGRIVLGGVISDAAGGTAGRLVKSGNGTLVLKGKNTYTGGTTISGGTLQLDPGGSIVGNVANNGRLVFNQQTETRFSGAIGGSGSIEKQGSDNVILTGENTYTGGTTISSGNLTVGNGGTSGSIVGDVVNNGGLTFSRADNVTFDGVISGKGGVVKTAPGSLRLTGTSTYAGPTTISEGELRLDGSLTTSRINVLNRGPDPKTGRPRSPGRLSGSGSTTGKVIVRAGAVVAPGDGTAGKALTLGDLDMLAGSVLEIDAEEAATGGLSADRLNVTGTATFGEASPGSGAPYGPTLIDVTFDANATIPALEGITVLAADGGLKGVAPGIVLDPASLPNGQNFHLNLEATNLGGTFAGPGDPIPAGAGGQGFVVLQVVNADPTYTTPPQITAINGPYLVPSGQSVLTPIQVPYLIPTTTPTATPILAPALVKGPTSNVTTPVVGTNTGGKTPATGIKVQNHGVQLGGGTLTPQPQTATGTPVNPNTIQVGTVNTVVVVEPPTGLGTTDFVSISGSYGKVSQINSRTGTKYALIYTPHEVQVAKIPTNYGNLKTLGVTQTGTQRAVGNAVTSMLPEPHARASTTAQANLVSGLYPLPSGDVNDALDSIAGVDEDPTFVTVLNTREFQDSMDTRLRNLRDGVAGTTDAVTQGTTTPMSDRQVWGEFLGGYADGDYLNGSEIRTWGLVLGADQSIASNAVVGVALSYSDAGIDTDSGSQDDVSTLEAALYGGWTSGDWFLNGNVGASYNWLDMDRAIRVGSYADSVSG